MQTIIDSALEYVKKIFESDFSGHDYFHTLRVYKTVVRIAKAEGLSFLLFELAL